MGKNHTFRVSFVSIPGDSTALPASQLLAKVRIGPLWDAATIFAKDQELPRLYVAWLDDHGYIVHCFEDDAFFGNFLVIDRVFSKPEVEINLDGQSLERWPAQLFVPEELASRAIEFFLESGKRDPAQTWIGTDAFPRKIVWEGRAQRTAYERSQHERRDP